MTVTTESPGTPAAPAARPEARVEHRVGGGLLDPKMLWKATPDAFRKLDPRVQVKNPVMFVVEVGALLCMYTAIRCAGPSGRRWPGGWFPGSPVRIPPQCARSRCPARR
jgi:K+-transporting ATPase ATPase B chain